MPRSSNDCNLGHPRPDTTVEKLSALKPLFLGGTVTAGNASGVNDGAAAMCSQLSRECPALRSKIYFVCNFASGEDPSAWPTDRDLAPVSF